MEMTLAIKAYKEAADLFETEPDNTRYLKKKI